MKGDSGNSGTSGTSGTNGSAGTSGAAAASGSSTVSGTSGTSGSSGTNGVSAIPGGSTLSATSGTSGSNGTSGASAAAGASSVSQTSGTSGSSGTNGATAAAGTSTSSQTSGTSGSSGTSGAARTAGSSSNSGTSGTSGSSGTSGLSFNGTSGISGGTFTNQPDYLVRTTGTATIQSVSFLYADITNSRLGIGTTSPTRTLDVNGDVGFSNELFLWDNEYALTAGTIARGDLPGGPTFLAGVTSINSTTATPPTNVSAQGTIITGASDSALTAGQLVYYRTGTSRWALSDADVIGTVIDLIGIVLNTVGAAANEISILIEGIYTTTFVDGGSLIGDPLYISQTAGNVTPTTPSAAGTFVRGIGHVVGSNGTTRQISFRPDVSYYTNG
jgi:hypothetical protein